MSRLQKKCLIATAGTHLLLVVLLFCSGFIKSQPQPDKTQLLDLIPPNVVEMAENRGTHSTPKPPEKLPEKPPEKQPDPPKPPEKIKDPDPLPQPPEKNPDVTLPPVKPKPQEHKVEVDLHKKVTITPKPNTPKDTTAADEAKEQRRLEKERHDRATKLSQLADNLKNNLSSSTQVEIPLNSGAAAANYASVVRSVYEAAWHPPDDAANDEAVTKVSVTIARSGNVVESHIVTPSGDARVDASIRRMLDHVDFVHEFPEDMKDMQKTFIINFNLKSKRTSG
jgi:colicin import membrane protein